MGVGLAFVAGFFIGAVAIVIAAALAVAGEEEALQEDPSAQKKTPLR